MSFLEKEDAKPSSMWDWVVGVGLVVLVGGFTFFYQNQKRSSARRFHAADSLFHAGDYRSAVKLYVELKDAQYLTTVHDSTIYARLDSVEAMEDEEKEAFSLARAKLAAGDTSGARSELSSQNFRGLLAPKEQAALDALKAILTPN